MFTVWSSGVALISCKKEKVWSSAEKYCQEKNQSLAFALSLKQSEAAMAHGETLKWIQFGAGGRAGPSTSPVTQELFKVRLWRTKPLFSQQTRGEQVSWDSDERDQSGSDQQFPSDADAAEERGFILMSRLQHREDWQPLGHQCGA